METTVPLDTKIVPLDTKIRLKFSGEVTERDSCWINVTSDAGGKYALWYTTANEDFSITPKVTGGQIYTDGNLTAVAIAASWSKLVHVYDTSNGQSLGSGDEFLKKHPKAVCAYGSATNKMGDRVSVDITGKAVMSFEGFIKFYSDNTTSWHKIIDAKPKDFSALVPEYKVGEIWRDKGRNYIYMHRGEIGNRFFCPTWSTHNLVAEDFYRNHPNAVKVYSPPAS